MKYFYALIGAFLYLGSTACECSEQPLILDLYSADVVFTGTAIDKNYSSDSTEYTITFRTSKFYKNSRADQEILKFTKVAEGRYSKQWSSCDYHLNAGNEWLIIAYYRDEEITFGYCSESRKLTKDL